MNVLRRHLSYANVMATLAVFVALGGSSYAAIKLSANSVGHRELKQSAVTPAKLSPKALALVRQSGGTGHAAASPALQAFDISRTVQPGKTDSVQLKCPRAQRHAISGYFGTNEKSAFGKLVLTTSTPVSGSPPRSWATEIVNLDSQPHKWYGGAICMR